MSKRADCCKSLLAVCPGGPGAGRGVRPCSLGSSTLCIDVTVNTLPRSCSLERSGMTHQRWCVCGNFLELLQQAVGDRNACFCTSVVPLQSNWYGSRR
jgi:hypothetical protein